MIEDTFTRFWGPTYADNVIGNWTLDGTESFTWGQKILKNWNLIYIK